LSTSPSLLSAFCLSNNNWFLFVGRMFPAHVMTLLGNNNQPSDAADTKLF
jgi:hypothetical protein